MSIFRSGTPGNTHNGGATTFVATWANGTQAGDTRIVALWVNGGTGVDVVAPSGYSLLPKGVAQQGTAVWLAIYLYPNAPALAAGATETFTIVTPGTTTPLSAEAAGGWGAIPGLVSASVVDQDNQAASPSVATADSGSATPTVSDYAVAAVAHNSAPPSFDLDTASATGGFTLIAKDGSTSSGALKINGAWFEKDLAGGLTAQDLTVPITGGTRSMCGKIVLLKKQTGAPTTGAGDNGKVSGNRSMELHYYSFTFPDAATATAWAAQHGVIMGQPKKFGGFADQMQAANASLIMAPYDKSVQVDPSTYGVTDWPEAMFAHSGSPATSANRVQVGGFPGVYIMQADSTVAWTDTAGKIGPAGTVYHGWAQVERQLIKGDVQAANNLYPSADPFTGGFLDSAGSFSLQNQVIPGTSTKYTAATWLPLVNQVCDAVTAYVPTLSVWANGVDSNSDLPNHVSGGVMLENWLWGSNDGASSWPSTSKFESGVQTALDTQLVDAKAIRLVTHAWGLSAAADIEHRRRGLVAAFFLAQRGSCFFEYSVTRSTAPWLINHGPSFAVDLGTPIDSKSQATGYRLKQGSGGGWVYRRRFNKGEVLFNTDTNPVVITLDRSTYKELDGTAAPVTYTVPAKSGVIHTSVAAAAAPTNTVAPSFTGTQTQGQILTGNRGTWTGSPSFAQQWQRSPHGAGTWSDIPGATALNYTLQAADVGQDVRLSVTGTNSGGSLTAFSTASGAIASSGSPPPSNTALPVISGTPTSGQTLTTTDGTWTGSPTSFAYQWQHVDPSAPSTVTDIGGATSNSYDLVDADTGFLIQVRVTATNANGSTPITSAPTDVVAPRSPAVPQNTVAPSAPTGSTQVGSTLTASTGTWTGATSFLYRFQLVVTAGDGSQTINDLTTDQAANTYVTQETDVGGQVQCLVTGVNSSGTGQATSAPTSIIYETSPTPPPPPPVPVEPTLKLLICDRDGTPIGPPIPGATGRSLTLQLQAPAVFTFTAPLASAGFDTLEEGYHRLKAYLDDQLVFHGRIWQVTDTAQVDSTGAVTEQTTITAYDPLYTMSLTPYAPQMSRDEILGPSADPVPFNATYFSIARNLLTAFSGAGGSSPGELLIGNTIGTPPRVKRRIKAEDLLLDWMTQNLARFDDGVEWICRPVEGTVTSYDTAAILGATTPVPARIEQIGALDVYYPHAGGVQPVTLGYGTAGQNIIGVQQDSDASQRVNWSVVAGAGIGKHPAARQRYDAAAVEHLGVIYMQDQLSNSSNATLLQLRAAYNLHPEPQRALTLTPHPTLVRYWTDFQVGDTVNVAIKRGRLQRYGTQRVYSATVSWQDQGGSMTLDQITIGD